MTGEVVSLLVSLFDELLWGGSELEVVCQSQCMQGYTTKESPT